MALDRMRSDRILLLLITLLLVGACARSPEAKRERYIARGDRYFQKERYPEAILEYRNALRIDGNNIRAIRQLGLAHYELGQLSQAFRYLLKAKEMEPDNSAVALKLASIYLASGRPDDAQAEAERVLQQSPRDLDALVLAARAANTPAEVDAALRRLEAVRSEAGSQAKFHLVLANLYMRKQDRPAAERALQEAVAREPKSVEAHTALGDFYVITKQLGPAEREFKTAADLAPVGSPARVKLADFYILSGNRDEARNILVEITQKAPDFAPAWRLLAELSFAQGKLDETAKALDALLKKNPGDLDGMLLRGRLYLAKRETSQAIQQFQAVLKAEPRLAIARYHLALAQIQAGSLEQAKADLAETLRTAPNFVEAILLLAQLNLQSGAVGPAIDGLKKLITTQPRATGAYALLGTAYLARREPAQAIDIARKLQSVSPKDPRGPYMAGLGLVAQGKRTEARREFEAALELAPGWLDPLAQLVSQDVADKRAPAAIARIQQQITAVAPRSATHQSLLGQTYQAAGETNLAEAAFRKAMELEPRWTEPYIRLGGLYASTGRYDEALAKLKDAIKNDPQNQVALMLAGVMYEQKGDVAEARGTYERLLAMNPRFIPAANNLAWIYSEYGGDKDKALQLARTAKEGAPDDPRISDTLGWILYKRGIYQQALALLKESAAKLPGNPQVQYHLGMAYLQVGDKDNARKALAAAANSPASFQGKDEARKTLAGL
jgi:tetratricopeptide (TPR) repeat protein